MSHKPSNLTRIEKIPTNEDSVVDIPAFLFFGYIAKFTKKTSYV